MQHCRIKATDGVEFWISCKQPDFGLLQVIQNKCPWCWNAAYVTAGCTILLCFLRLSKSPKILINYFSQWSTRHLKWACNLRACRAFFGLWKNRLQPILWFPVHHWIILIHNIFESCKYESQVLLTNLHVTKLWLSKLLKILFDIWSNLKKISSMLVFCNL
jgi:hypothetical protein